VVIFAASSVSFRTVIEPALPAGVLSLFVEKLLATTLEVSHRLLEAMDDSGVPSLVNCLFNCYPSMFEFSLIGRRLSSNVKKAKVIA
jgi:hypothetical protein